MNPERPEQLLPTLDLLATMPPEAAEDHIRSLHLAAPTLAAEVHSHLQCHLSRTRGTAVPTDGQPEYCAPQRQSLKAGECLPSTIGHAAESEAPTTNVACPSAQGGSPGGISNSRYQILEELGGGTFGIVYKAIDTRTGQTVALKVMRRTGSRELEFFKGEFRYLQGTSHGNLAQLLELESDGLSCMIAMEFVPGMDFLRYVRFEKERGPNFGRLRVAVRQLAEGVAALHRHRRLHRDLKPQNVRVTPEGRVVVLDFGLAAEAGPGGELRYADRSAPGTVPYMAPEQFHHPPVSSTASDYYSLGVMLYESLAGHWPFTGSLCQIVRDKANRDPIPPRDLYPETPEDLNTLCMALLARQPQERPAAEEIFRRLGHTPVHGVDASSNGAGVSLLGRERDLDELGRAYREAKQGDAVVVRVHGPSGIGKSWLVGHFTDQLRSEGAVVLAGRCYEHESVPFKSLDPVIDELARYLRTLPEQVVQALRRANLVSWSGCFRFSSGSIRKTWRQVRRRLRTCKRCDDGVL